MDGLVALLFKTRLSETFNHPLLGISLPGIDHIDDPVSFSKVMGESIRRLTFRSGRPEHLSVGLKPPGLIQKILLEKPEFPELISHALSCIGDTPVGSNENLVQAFNSILCLNKDTERNKPTSPIEASF